MESGQEMSTHRKPDASRDRRDPAHPRVGLALGGGGARGYAHLGVIRTLREQGIPLDLVVGTSMGAVMGGAFACGHDLYKLEEVLKELNLNRLLGFPSSNRALAEVIGRTAREYLTPGQGRAHWRRKDPERTQKLLTFFRLLTRERNFEDLEIPFAAIAADIDTGEEVVLRRGPIYRAISASVAVPGLHDPVRLDGRYLVDGGVVNKVPVDVAVALGAQVVIAVDVGGALAPNVYTSLEVLTQASSVTSRELTRVKLDLMRARLGERLVVLRPSVAGVKMLALHEVATPVRAGEREARARLPAIRAALAAASD